VKTFQESHGLDGDGIAGPETFSKLEVFEEMTPEVAAKATVQPDEQNFEGEPLPELKGSDVVAGADIDVPEGKSVWGKVKGWFS